MAAIYKRKNRNGTISWRAVIRIKGHPTICNHFELKQDADDWVADVERQIKLGQFKLERHKAQATFADLLDRYYSSGILEHRKSAEETKRHLNYWKERLKCYALAYITTELIAKERELLANTPTQKGTPRSSATTNRYVAALSSIMSYCCRTLGWISENPCRNVIMLKEPPGRDRILSDDELRRLLKACRESKNEYLYCIVLMALTTGARKSEILGLMWEQGIDFESKLAHLRITKNGKPRSLPLVPEVITELQKLYQQRNPFKKLVFASKTTSGRIDFRKPWVAALKRAGIRDFVFHSLRHQFATLASRQGASTLELQLATGHLSVESLQVYTHMQGQMVRKFSDNIAKRILGNKSDVSNNED